MDEIENASSTGPITQMLLGIELFLLVPWFFFALFAGMAFDGGSSFRVWAVVLSIWTYPITLTLAFVLRKKFLFVLLPAVNIAIFWITG